MRFYALGHAVIFLFTITMAHAHNLGVYGPVYAIQETHFLDFIHAKLTSLQSSGQLDAWQAGVKQRVTKGIDRPSPVPGVTLTKQPMVHYYDPTLIVPYPIVDHQSKVLIAAGTRINPLDTVSLSAPLLFFDGDDSRQIQWAKRQLRVFKLAKLVLVAGSIKSQARQFKRKVYFDQQGILVKKLAITQVPAVVRQVGKRLQISEQKP